MQTLKSPAQIDYGWIRDMQYLPDFGRHEAAVVLHLIEDSGDRHDIELITSVDAHPDEDPIALHQRLVMDAARLLRLSETGLAEQEEMPLAA